MLRMLNMYKHSQKGEYKAKLVMGYNLRKINYRMSNH